MKTTAISDHGWQLTRYGLINMYLVQEPDGWTLIDTGIGGSEGEILKAASALGAERIQRILLTHAHVDHVGSADALVARLPGVEVIISARDERLLRKPPAQDLSLDPGEPQGKIKGGLPGIATKPTRLLADGDRIGSLIALATPGHTPGHMSFFDERDGTLYAGDELVLVGGGVHVSSFGPWYFPLPTMATWDPPTALGSARRLLERIGPGIRAFGAGHGRLVRGGQELLLGAIERAAQ